MIDGLKILSPEIFSDSRGSFLEIFNQSKLNDAGINESFVQDNISISAKNVLRGIHFQKKNPQGKLVTVLEGEVYDVAVDLRKESPTFGKWESVILNGIDKQQFWIPPGFGHGFQVISEKAIFHYKCTNFYDKLSEKTLIWNDTALNIPWPCKQPELSQKDMHGKRLYELDL